MEAAQQSTKSEQLAAQREALRVKKEPFQTIIVDGLLPTTIDALRGWIPPRGAYILFEQRKNFIQPDQTLQQGSALMTLWVEDRPEQFERFRRMIRKGCRPIHYANFPKLNDPNPARASKARLHSGPDGRNPWDVLESEVREALRTNPNWKEEKAILEREKQALEAKYQEALKKKSGQ